LQLDHDFALLLKFFLQFQDTITQLLVIALKVSNVSQRFYFLHPSICVSGHFLVQPPIVVTLEISEMISDSERRSNHPE
jgi:hypothetical protein